MSQQQEVTAAIAKIWDLMENLSEIITDHQTAYMLMDLSKQIGILTEEVKSKERGAESVKSNNITLQERWEEEGMWLDVIFKDDVKTSFLKRYAPYANRTEGRSYNHDYLPLDRAMVCINLERENINY